MEITAGRFGARVAWVLQELLAIADPGQATADALPGHDLLVGAADRRLGGAFVGGAAEGRPVSDSARARHRAAMEELARRMQVLRHSPGYDHFDGRRELGSMTTLARVLEEGAEPEGEGEDEDEEGGVVLELLDYYETGPGPVHELERFDEQYVLSFFPPPAEAEGDPADPEEEVPARDANSGGQGGATRPPWPRDCIGFPPTSC